MEIVKRINKFFSYWNLKNSKVVEEIIPKGPAYTELRERANFIENISCLEAFLIILFGYYYWDSGQISETSMYIVFGMSVFVFFMGCILTQLMKINSLMITDNGRM